MAQKKSAPGSLAKQIDAAKKNIESWPSWLRESARFQGKNHSFDQRAADPSSQDRAIAGGSEEDAKHDC